MRSPTRALLLLALTGLAGRVASAGDDFRRRVLSADPVEAYKAAEEAAATKSVENAGPLLEAGWQTIHPHVAIACGDALAAVGPAAAENPDYQKVLAKALKGKDPRGLMNLARVLGAYGDASVDDPLSFVASGRRQPEVQAEGLYMVGSLVPTPERPFAKCVQAVAAGLKSKTAEVQMAACSAAARIRDPSYTEALLDLVRTSQDRFAGLYAEWALSRMANRGSLGSFVRVVEGNAKRETVDACLKAVTDLSGPDDVEALLALTRSPRKDNRDAACLALGAVARSGKFAAPVVTREGEKPPPAAEAASKVVDRLLQIVESDKDWEVRDAASRSLQRIGEPARAQVVAKAPALADASERDVALTAIELCGVFRAEEAFKPLMKIATFDKDPARRMYAARALGAIDPKRAAEEFLASVQRDHKGRESTLNMVRALGYLRHEAAYDGLVTMVGQSEWSEEMLKDVERSLERLTAHRFGRKPDRWAAWYEKAKAGDPFRPHLGRYDRSKNRREAVAKRLYGLTEGTERSVESGLRWMEQQQHPEGYWDGNDRGMGGVVNCLPAYTGLALLAYCGAGYDGVHGKFREQMRRAAEFLAATQFYDGGFPVTGGGDNSWIFAYLVGMGVWALNESYALSGTELLHGPAQRGIDYLVRVQTPGAGWRYGPRYVQSDTSCTSWVLMTLKTASLLDLEIPQKALDGIDSWLERCQFDVTGEDERPEDMVTDYDKEVGTKRYFKAFTGYLTLSGNEASSLQQTSMTAVGMTCRFFMGWRRSHPFLIGSANYLMDYLPQWRRGLEKNMAVAWYFYYYYYGTLAMHQMGGRYWRAWNEKIKTMLPENQRTDPPELAGSWDPDSALLNGGRLFSTPMAILTLETYYRFSPLMLESDEDAAARIKREKEAKAAAGMDGNAPPPPAMDDGASMDR